MEILDRDNKCIALLKTNSAISFKQPKHTYIQRQYNIECYAAGAAASPRTATVSYREKRVGFFPQSFDDIEPDAWCDLHSICYELGVAVNTIYCKEFTNDENKFLQLRTSQAMLTD